MSGFTLRDMILHGWPVLSVLLIMSIVSVTTMVDRLVTLSRARANAGRFAANIIRILEEQGRAQALDYCRRFSKPVAFVMDAILRQPGKRAAKERVLQHTLQAQIRELEYMVPVLATVASTAPFVGLFGTVVGIIKAFASIAANVGGGPEVVASGIAEALITTACGLLVAIPALMGYNYFVHQVERLVDEIDLAAYEVIDRLSSDED